MPEPDAQIPQSELSSQELRTNFRPDEIVKGPELEGVVDMGLVNIRSILDNDPNVKYERTTNPPDKAMPNEHRSVKKGDVIYTFRDGPWTNTQTGDVDGEGVRILRVESGNEEDIRVLKGVNGLGSTVESKGVFVPQEHPGITVSFNQERSRGKLARVGEWFGRRSVPPGTYVISTDHPPINSGLAINNMNELITKMENDFRPQTQKPITSTQEEPVHND